MSRGSDRAVRPAFAVVELRRRPAGGIARVIGPFTDGAAAEMWAIEHGYRDYSITQLVWLDELQ